MRACVLVLAAGLSLFAQTGPDSLFEKARAAQLAGRLDEAEQRYRQYLKQYKARPEILANLGALLARREDFTGAIQLYEQALKMDPSLVPLHLNLGLAYLKQGQAARSVPEFDVFLKAQPTHAQARQLRALALLESEQYAAAEQQYRQLLPSEDPSIHLGLATALIRQKKAAEARAVLEPILTRADSAQGQLALGQILLQEGRFNEALDALMAARRLNPNLPQLRLSIGAAWWRLRRTDEAVKEWRAEYEAHPQSFESAYTLGCALSLNDDSRAEAETLLRKAVQMRPRNARANYQLAKLVWQKAKSPEAVTFLQRAIEADPEFREAFFLHATVLSSLGRKAEAAKSFARVKELSAKELARQQDLFSELP